MKHVLSILILLACAQVGLGQLQGSLSGTLGPGTFTVVGDIRVDTSAALTILAPTTLDFQDTFSFKIYGVLTAVGSPGNTILFTTSRVAPNRWRSLRFLGIVSSGSRLAYCVIENGWATGPTMSDQCGGGVYIYEASPSFAHCLIQNNYADACGGGVYSEYSRAVFDTCVITGDTTQSSHPSNWWGGAGVLCVYGRETYNNCTITQNVCLLGNGGGAWIEWDSASFNDCTIEQNTALSLDGGGVYCFWHAIPTFTNCSISRNTAVRDGAGTWCDDTSFPIYNFCTLSDNSAGGSGGGVFCQVASWVVGPMHNSCIIAYSTGEGMYFLSSTGCNISYCDFFGNSGGDFGGAVPPGLGIISGVNANGDPCDAFTNIFGNPWFLNRPIDLHITGASRCVGAADPFLSVFTDFEAGIRPDPAPSSPDIGMDEDPNGVPVGGLSGPLSGTLGPGYFTVVGDIRVDTSASLTIIPPTTLDFSGPFSFKIYGTFTAIGTPSSRITFTTSRTGTNRWRGLRFLGPAASSSQLAWCVVEFGYATGGVFADQCGGGVYCYQASPHFSQCLIHNNWADACGGGVYSEYSQAVFDTCTVTLDTAQSIHPSNWWGGGGVLCVYGRETYRNCTITQNVTLFGNGGGAWIELDTASFTDCIIEQNSTATFDGGGVYCFWYAVPTFTNCSISTNIAMRDGGGTWCDDTSYPTYDFCTLSDNVAGGVGGGAYCLDSPPPLGPAYSNCIIGYSTGEGIFFSNSSGSAISYCDFFGNSAGDFGGAVPPNLGVISGSNINGDPSDIFMNIFNDPWFVNHPFDLHIQAASCCIGAADPTSGLSMDFEGGIRPDPPLTFPDIGMDENPNATPGQCLSGILVGSIGPGTYCVTGNILIPMYNSLTIQPGTIFDFQGPFSFDIAGTLNAVGTGINQILFTSSLSGTNRWRGLRFLSAAASGQLVYCTIENGYATGAALMDSCGGGVLILGSYVSFYLCTIQNNTADLYGGGVYVKGSSPRFSHSGVFNNTVNSPGNGGGVYLRNSSAVFDTCTINWNSAGLSGGGVWCDTSASPTFRHCQIAVNIAGWDAGGVYCDTMSAAVFDSCSIVDNTATNGGGLYFRLSYPILTGCLIDHNTGTSLWGGVVCGDRSSATFDNCQITNNAGTGRGGGVWFWSATGNFTNCLVASNSATLGGGVGVDWNSSPSLRHCTIYGNTGTAGAGMWLWGSSPVINSSIIAFSNGAGICFEGSAASHVGYCDFFNNSGGDFTFYNSNPAEGPSGIGVLGGTNVNGDSVDIYNNIFLDPQFVNTTYYDYHLNDYSHCLGAADNNGLVITDFDGNLRPNPPGSIPDVGAYENVHGAPPVPPVNDLVIHLQGGNAVLDWSAVPGAVSYNIYGQTAPIPPGTLLVNVVNVSWTDVNTTSRPSPYYYYVTAVRP